MKTLIVAMTLSFTAMTQSAFANDDKAQAVNLLSNDQVQTHLNTEIAKPSIDLNDTMIVAQATRTLEQASLTYEINARVAAAKQQLPRNQFRVTIAD